jgi:hypothetical protein
VGKEDEGTDCDDDVACAWTEREPFPTPTAGEGGICSYQDDPDPDPDAGTRPGDGAGENAGDRRLGSGTEGSPCSRTAAGEVPAAGEVEVSSSMSARVSVQGVNAMRVGEGARVSGGGLLCEGEERRNGSASRR